MEDVVVKYTEEQFLQTTEPYDYLAGISNQMERDREVTAYRKYALKACGISAATFKLAMKEAIARANDKRLKEGAQDGNARLTSFTGQPLELVLPAGYYCNDGGIWKETAFGGSAPVLMHPIMPSRRIVDCETHEHKTEIAFRIGGKWLSQIVSRDVLSSRAAFTKQMSLADAFITSENCAGVITFLADIEAANIDRLGMAHSTGRMGWHNGAFLPYEEGLLFDGDARFRAAYDSITSAGSQEKWFQLASDVRKSAGIPERIALAAGFASAALAPLKGMPFCLHLWSDQSGTGKTVALMLAASIWGNPRIGRYTQTLNATNVGIEMLGGFYNSLPLCLDELCTRDNRQKAEDLVYEYCSNTGRVRGSRNGGLQRQQSWCNCMITTGETPILSDDSRAGAENRVVEVETAGKLFGGRAKDVVKTLQDNYGHAGKLFVRALQQDGAIEQLRKYCADYEGQLESAGATEKQSKAMAVILAVDKFVALKLFDDVHNLRAEDVVGMTKCEEQVDTNLRAYNALMDAVAVNNRCFEPRDERTNAPLYGKIDERGGGVTYVCIIRSKLDVLLMDRDTGKRYNVTSFLKWARREGLLGLNNRGEPTKNVKLHEMPGAAPRCVCIRLRQETEDSAPGKIAPDGMLQVELSRDEIPF